MPFNRQSVVKYARKWALSTNPEYPRFENDCTSFASQSLYAGGWTMIGKHSALDRKADNVWWYGGSLFTRASYTWGGAQNFHDFLSVSGRGTKVTGPAALDLGDIVQLKGSDGIVYHTMVVTGKTQNDLLLSYHTTDHLDESLNAIRERNPDDSLVYWKVSDSNF
jgi:hypothetical protein